MTPVATNNLFVALATFRHGSHRIGWPGTVSDPRPPHHRTCRSASGGSRSAREPLMFCQEAHETHAGERGVG